MSSYEEITEEISGHSVWEFKYSPEGALTEWREFNDDQLLGTVKFSFEEKKKPLFR